MTDPGVEADVLAGIGGPSAESIAVYTHAMRQGSITVDDAMAALGLPRLLAQQVIRQLRGFHLLRDGTGPDRHRLVPVDPEVASASLISPIDHEVHRRRAAISEIRQHLTAFRPHYDERRQARPDGEGIEEIRDLTDLTGHLYLAAEECTDDFVGFPASGRPALRRSAATPFDLDDWMALAERGVRVRLLMQHAVRTDIRARVHLDALIARGAEVRTTSQLPRQLMIFDAKKAFLLHGDAQSGRLGVVIAHAATVALLLEVVESALNSGHVYTAEQLGYHEVADSLRHTVIELLADGLTDEAIARRLGLSVRTCRRHIAAVLHSLGAVSRFQAGVLATASGIVDRRTRARRGERQLRAAG
jgi:DNA-binding CsgD family transcriptional regulator